MFLDSHAQELMHAQIDEPFPCLAELRVFPLPGKTLFSCTVAVDDLCGVLVQTQYKGASPHGAARDLSKTGDCPYRRAF